MRLLGSVITGLVALSVCGAAVAEDYPNRPIRVLVGLAAGGNIDTSTRIASKRLAEILGVPVVVENKPGEGGNIAAEAVARSQPDGYTLLACGATSHGANSALFAKLPYDPVNDFAPITMFGTVPNVLEVNPAIPVTTLDQLIAWAKADPTRANMSSAGLGTSQHLSIELLKSMTGLQLTHVPYKGGAPAIADVLAGQVPAMIAGLPTALPSISARKVRAIAATSAKRSPQLPGVPTMAEAVVAGYEVNNWVGLCAPAGVAPATLAKLYGALQTTMNSPEVQKSMDGVGYEPANISPIELAVFIQKEIPKWQKVVRNAGIKPE